MTQHLQKIDSTFKGDKGEILFEGEGIASFDRVELAESTKYAVSCDDRVAVRYWVDVTIPIAYINREHLNLFGYEKVPGGWKIADTSTKNSFTIIAQGILLNNGTYKRATVSEVYFEGIPSPLGKTQLFGKGNNVRYENIPNM